MTTTTTRRAMLAGTAALPAITTTTAFADIWASRPDPIFAALSAFRRADAACIAVDGNVPDHLMGARDDAADILLRTRPTTPAGLSAFTGWAREQADWLCRNGSTWAPQHLSKVAAAIDDATRGMAGLAPWSPPASTVTGDDPILAAIEAHRAAVATHIVIQEEEFRLEEELPLDRRRWSWLSEESLDDAAKRDDHRWLDNCVQGHQAFERMDAFAADLIETRATTPAGVAALLAYVAAELTRGHGNLPPEIEAADDEDEGSGPLAEHRWLVLLLRAAAGALSGGAPHAA